MASFEENIEIWRAISFKARGGAAAAATGMAKYIAYRSANDMLQRSSHGSGAWHRTRPGEPPARATGKLAKGMYYTPAYSTGMSATSYVGNRVDYSRIIEFGCVIEAVNNSFVHWTDSGGSWYHAFLVSPPHPFLEPTTDESFEDGSLRDEAIDAFIPFDP